MVEDEKQLPSGSTAEIPENDADAQATVDEPSLQQASEIAKEKTKEFSTSIWNLVIDHASRESRFSAPAVKEKAKLPKFKSRFPLLIKLLKSYRWVLVATFLGSLFWDFDGVSATVFGVFLNFEGLLKILSVSGLIGFGTNWLAIKMLFKPEKKRPLLGHGLIPAQKGRIAFRLAQGVSQQLINPEIIKQKIVDSQIISVYRKKSVQYIQTIIDEPSFREELKNIVRGYVDEMINDQGLRTSLAQNILSRIEDNLQEKSIEKLALKAYRFLRGDEAHEIVEQALDRIPEGIEMVLDKLDTILDEIPNRLETHGASIEDVVTKAVYWLVNRLDVHNLIEENINKFDEQRLENLIRGAANEQLDYIQYLGAVLGTVGGFVIWSPWVALALGVIFGAVAGIDSLMFNAAEKKKELEAGAQSAGQLSEPKPEPVTVPTPAKESTPTSSSQSS